MNDQFPVARNQQPPPRSVTKWDVWRETIQLAKVGEWITISHLPSKGTFSNYVSVWNSGEVWGKGIFASLRWVYDEEAQYFVVYVIKKQMEVVK